MLWWFAETTLVAGVLAGAAALCGRLGTISSTARHVLWLVVLIKLIMPPVIHSPWALPAPLAFWPESENGLATVPVAVLRTVLPAPTLSTSEVISSPVQESSPVAASDALAGSVQETARQPDRASVTEPSVGGSRWRSYLGRLSGSLSIRGLLLSLWGLGTVVLALLQSSRIVAFRRRLHDAVPAPAWLVQETEQLGERLQVRVPEILVVPGLGTPMLWCLGRPKLLLPGQLIKSIEVDRWRGILAHELAHIRRGDQWVGRLELAAGLLWWWNPIYWLTCRRLDAEAELACDAWVVWALPHERLNYAEVLFQVCSEFSRVGSPSPALGVAGSGRFFERRLSMILYERSSCRVSPPVLLAVGLLALLSLPSWTFATSSALIGPVQDAAPTRGLSSQHPAAGQDVDDKDDDDDRDDDAMDDNDADDDDQAAAKSSRDKAAAKEKDKEKARKPKAAKGDGDVDLDLSGIEKEIESALGPDFEKKIEAWAEKFSKEIEEKFGENSEFVKKMEAFGEEMEKKFGDDSEFAKKMEALGEEMEKKFGDDSEFAKKMETLGKDLEKKFGPGSDFEKKIKEKFGPGSDFEKKMKALGEDIKVKEQQKKQEKAQSEKPQSQSGSKKSKPAVSPKSRDQRIKAIEAQLQQLLGELKALKDSDDGREE